MGEVTGPSSLDEVNMLSFIGISFVVKSDVEVDKLGFYVLLLKWTEREIEF
jgi:hypothetical protein